MNQTTKCPTCGSHLPEDAPSGICPQCLLLAGLESQENELRSGGRNPTTARAGTFDPPSLDDVAQLLPNLEVLELLGHGGMGAVYKARQTKLDRIVAVKILPPEIGAAPAFSERFNREAKTLARLAHPNIVSVYDFGESDGVCFIVMEFVNGLNLRQLIESGELESDQALAIVPQICNALQYAHSEGVVHRDVKPENILIDRDGSVRIADFGLAKLLDSQQSKQFLTGTHQIMGTPHYMAPEQLQGTRTVDHRADIYSLGVVFYELLTGELPIGNFEPPSQKVKVDVRLDEVVLRALENEPSRRYQKASDVQHDLNSLSQIPATDKPNPYTQSTPVAEQLKLPGKALVAIGIFNWILMPVCVAITAYNLNAQSIQSGTDVKWMTFSVFSTAILLVSSLASSIMIVGGMKLLNSTSSGWAKCGAIAAILLMPGNLIGLPIGIWVLVTLASDNIRNNPGQPLTKSVPRQPIFSRKAILGACWAPFFLIAAFMFLSTSTRVEHRQPDAEPIVETIETGNGKTVITRASASNSNELENAPGDRPTWQWVALISTGLFGLAAPFATTILGFISIADIRHSQGRIYGMSLAVTDALLFPLLVIDGLLAIMISRLVFVVANLASQAGWQFSLSEWGVFSIVLLIWLPVCILTDYMVVRWYWRKVNEPLLPNA